MNKRITTESTEDTEGEKYFSSVFSVVKYKTIILRHRRENLRKCSLRGLEGDPDLLFYTYPTDSLPDLTGYILLEVGAPPLTEADRESGLLLIDGTWRLAAQMRKSIFNRARLGFANSGGPQSGSDGSPNSHSLSGGGIVPIQARSLPFKYKTAYPRKQTECPDPESGLASVEALYLAHKILRRRTEGLLSNYHWKKAFLEMNDLGIA